VPPRDPVALADAIDALISDPERRRRMGAAAFARARAEFSVDVMVRRVLDVYRQVLAER